MRVLIERQENSGLYTGFSDNYLKVGVQAPEDLSNRMVMVQLDDVHDGLVAGAVVYGPEEVRRASCGTR